MGGDFFSGGVIIAVAAVLWLIYLVPTWTKRRKFMATERNAVRLQQALRVLVETNDVPEEVRLEAAAREAVEKMKALKTEEAIRRANVRASLWAAKRRAGKELVRLGVSRVFQISADVDARRVKRLRALCSLLSLASVVLTVVGVSLGMSAGNPAVALFGLTGLVAGVSRIVMLARITPSHVAVVRTGVALPEVPVWQAAAPPAPAAAATVNRSWTPTPLPKPLNRSVELPPVVTSFGMAVDETEHRAPVAPISQARTAAVSASAHSSETTSAFASMGIIDDADLGTTDLDAIFRLRRAAS